jgi:hypothetical protein
MRARNNAAAYQKSRAGTPLLRLMLCFGATQAPIAAPAARPTWLHEIEFSFLNGNLVVPPGRLFMFNHDAVAAIRKQSRRDRESTNN